MDSLTFRVFAFMLAEGMLVIFDFTHLQKGLGRSAHQT